MAPNAPQDVEESKSLLSGDVRKEKFEEKGSFVLYVSCFIVLLGAVSVGAMLGLTSPVIPGIQAMGPTSPLYLNTMQASWFGASVTVGAVVGAYIAGFIMQAIGRKFTSVLSGIPFIVGLIIISYASQLWMLFFGRVLTGFGVGIISLIVPTYIGEVSTAKMRGMLGSCNQLCIVSGILFVYGVGSVLPWRSIALAAIAPPALLSLLSLFIPETPTYLLQKDKPEAAKQSLTKLRAEDSDVELEFTILEEGLKNQEEQASWLEIIKDSSLRTPTLVSLGAMYFQQMSGINCVMFYAKSIFMTAGFSNPAQLTVAVLAIASTQVFFTAISCVIVDKTGRKPLLLIGAVLMTLSLTAFGVYFEIRAEGQHAVSHVMNTTLANVTNNVTSAVATASGSNPLSYLALVSLVVFIAGYSIGVGPIAWLLVGEIIPARAKERSAGLSTGFNYFLVFILTLEFSSMLVAFTSQGTFWIFATNCALSILFTVFIMPETKGKSLEEIEEIFRKKK